MQSSEVFTLLTRVNHLLAAAADHDQVMQTVLDLVVPIFADYSVLHLFGDEQRLVPAVVAHVQPDCLETLWELLRKFPPQAERETPASRVLRTGKPEMQSQIAHVDDPVLTTEPEQIRLNRILNPQSYIVVPLIAREQMIGILTLVLSVSERRYTEQDLELALLLAQSTALVLENARLHRENQREIAHHKQTNAALQQSQHMLELYRHVFENSRIGFSVWHMGDLDDPESFRLVTANPAAAEITHIHFDAYVGQRLYDAFPMGRDIHLAERYAEVIRSGQWQNYGESSSNLNAYMQTRVYSSKLLPLPDRYLVIAFEDVTERKRSEEMLQLYGQVFEHSRMGFVIWHLEDPDDPQSFRMITANQAASEITGIPHTNFIGKRLLEGFPNPRSAYLAELFTEIIRSGQWRDLGEQRSDFNEYMVNRIFIGKAVPLANRYLAISFDDVTVMKQAQEHLERLQAITAAFSTAATSETILHILAHEGFTVLGADAGTVCLLTDDNTMFDVVEAVGYPQKLYESWRRFPVSVPTHVSECVRIQAPVWVSSKAEYAQRYLPRESQNVDQHHQAWAALPLKIKGQLIGAMGISFPHPKQFTDSEKHFLITLAAQTGQALERAQLYEAEQAARARAEKADQLKLRFLGMISHELRTPLTSIKGFASTLRATDTTFSAADQAEFIRIIDEESDKLTELIDQLLDVSRIHAGTLSIEPAMHTLDELFAAADRHLKVLTEKHSLHISYPPDLPPLRIDLKRIAQVLVNLVSNGVKNSPPRTTITIGVERHEGFVEIGVSDQGIGIPPEARPSIFEPFRQLEGSSKHKGVGLGLAICKGVVENHGGRIWVAERDTPGTTIIFSLPVG